MSKNAKINQIKDIYATLQNNILPELLNTHKSFSEFDGSNLHETKNNMKLIVKHIETLIEEKNFNETSWHSLQNILSSLNNIQTIFSQFKHQQDQATFQNFSSQIDSCLQQIQMYAPHTFWADEILLRHNKDEIENLHRKIQAISTAKDELEGKIFTLNKSASEPIRLLNEKYQSTIEKLNTNENEVNTLLGVITAKSVAGSYSESARKERVTAEWLRILSLACMGAIVILVSYSLWQSTTQTLNWDSFALRAAVAFVLSIPAAYLARESAKHREQHYSHLQTALDLAAINPYLASLPDEQQHKIKAEIASRIFAARDFARMGADSYPLNTHELIMELIKKIEVRK
ncbi:MAG: hypothetical protein Q7T48_04725 [Cellvibrio sp.]|uniref:hypothetical protein n=1 Tax=Cellvibrio sp. TaxID=1965322 RepID=UPI0027237241|nr:hypothetical protein [Cellvibrio sp.]